MTFRVGLLSLFMLRKTVEKHYPGGMAALRKRYRVIYEKEGLVMLRDMTDQDAHRYATHLAHCGIEAGRLLTIFDGFCGPHFVSPGIVVERSRNDRRWPPFNWTVRASGADAPTLLDQLGWRQRNRHLTGLGGQKLVFLGDLIDRGPDGALVHPSILE